MAEVKISLSSVMMLCIALVGGTWGLSATFLTRNVRANEEKIDYVREVQIVVTTTLESMSRDIAEIKADVKTLASE